MDNKTLDKKIRRMENELLALKTASRAGLGTTRFYYYLLKSPWAEEVRNARIRITLSDEFGDTPLSMLEWTGASVGATLGTRNIELLFEGTTVPSSPSMLMLKSSAQIQSATWSHE